MYKNLKSRCLGICNLGNRRRSVGSLGNCKSVVLSIGLLLSAEAALGKPIGLPGVEYDLASLVNSTSQAVYDLGSDTITTTGTKAKLILTPMLASPPDQLRYVEVTLAPAVTVTLQANWWDPSFSNLMNSEIITVPPGEVQTVALNLSAMGDTGGAMNLRIKGAAAGSVIYQVRLVEVTKPNFIVILVDDLARVEYELGFGRSLDDWTPAIDTRFRDRGTVFEQFFNTTPLCCPSRASYHTGQYAHNHGIWGNNYGTTGGNGGWRRFHELAHEFDSIGVWMQDAGYNTVLIGKFMNGYPDRPGAFLPQTYVPAGWSEWYGEFNQGTTFSYFDFQLNENGTVVTVDDTYLTDYESALAVDYINRQTQAGQQFFMFLNPFAPHAPTEPALRHDGTHAVDPVPPPNFNEADLSDKPQHIQDGATFFLNYFNDGGDRKLDMTLALDEMITAIFDALEANGVEDHTYVFFTSDNGLLRGEHGIGGKSAPYEESSSFPLIVSGPGVPAGGTRQDLVLNIDIAPTILELAGATPPDYVDGESIVELMTGATPTEDWRDAVQIELLTEISGNQPHVIPPYAGIRTPYQCYIEYETGDRELYNLASDPYQLDSQHLLDPSGVLPILQPPLSALTNCSGEECREASRLGWPDAMGSVQCAELECTFDASMSFDKDGSVVEYNWDFGDGNGDAGASVTHNFASSGHYQVILTVVDDAGNPGIQVINITVSEPVTYVNDLTILPKTNNPLNLRAIGKVFVVDSLGNELGGATVEGDWTVNGNPAGSASGVTLSNGRAKLILLNPSSGDELEICITDITHPDYAYDPTSNNLTCSQEVFP